MQGKRRTRSSLLTRSGQCQRSFSNRSAPGIAPGPNSVSGSASCGYASGARLVYIFIIAALVLPGPSSGETSASSYHWRPSGALPLKDGELVVASSVAGGDLQEQTTLNLLMNYQYIHYGMSAGEAVVAPVLDQASRVQRGPQY